MPTQSKRIHVEARYIRRVGEYRSPVQSYQSYNGFVSLPEWPEVKKQLPYEGERFRLMDDCDWTHPDSPNWDIREDARSMGFQYFDTTADRMYAGVYAKAWDSARGTTAELGLNLIEYRKTLGTFCQLSVSALVAIESLRRTHIRGFRYLAAHLDTTPKKVEKRMSQKRATIAAIRARERQQRQKDRSTLKRVNNELYVLKEVANLLLAWRYGVAPLMGDIASTAEIMSSPPREPSVTVRKSAVRARQHTDKTGGREIRHNGKNRVTVVFTADVDNPNLALASQLGLVNPAYWLWDSTPWSHVIDWFYPVGQFLNSFTASMGFSYRGCSVTRTYAGEIFIKNVHGTRTFTGNGYAHRKVRATPTALPRPLSVPYGKGLTLTRAQNALAHIVQLLSPNRVTKVTI